MEMMMMMMMEMMMVVCSPVDNKACSDHLLRMSCRINCTWIQVWLGLWRNQNRWWNGEKTDAFPQMSSLVFENDGFTCRLHIWSIEHGKRFRLSEPPRFRSRFHTFHISPCASGRSIVMAVIITEDHRTEKHIWEAHHVIMIIKEQETYMRNSPCSPFHRRSCLRGSSRCQWSLPRTRSNVAGFPKHHHCHPSSPEQ